MLLSELSKERERVKSPDFFHSLEESPASLLLLCEAEAGLHQWLAGERVSTEELLKTLS
jgi:hypothetical protein